MRYRDLPIEPDTYDIQTEQSPSAVGRNGGGAAGDDDVPSVDWMARELERGRWGEVCPGQSHAIGTSAYSKHRRYPRRSRQCRYAIGLKALGIADAECSSPRGRGSDPETIKESIQAGLELGHEL